MSGSARWGIVILAGTVITAQACLYDYQALKGNPAGGLGGQPAATGGSADASGGARSEGAIGDRTGATGGHNPTGTGGSMGGAGGSGDGRGGATQGSGGKMGEGGHSAGGRGGARGMDSLGGRAPEGSGGSRFAAGGAGGETTGAAGDATGTAGIGGGGRGGAGGHETAGGATGSDPDLVLLYGFDEGTGTTSNETSGFAGGPRDAQLVSAGTGGSIAFSIVHQLGTYSVSMTGNGSSGGGYVTFSGLSSLAPSAATISLWANVTTASAWQRIFDYGTDTSQYMFLTSGNGSGNLHFAITKKGSTGEERILTNKSLKTGGWHHVALVLASGSPYTGTLFLDGVAVGTNTAMTLHPGDLGETPNNYLGRSQFTADPYFSGLIDDYRVYRRALTASEIASLFASR